MAYRPSAGAAAGSSLLSRYKTGAGSAFGVLGNIANRNTTPAPNRKTSITTKLPPSAGGASVGGATGVGSSVNPGSYNYSPTPPVSNFQSGAMESGGSADVDNWIASLKKELGGKGATPKLPEQVNLDKYSTELATIRDLEKKFGFDYSREYAERQAEVLAQAQRDAIQTARERAQMETESAKTDLDHDFFNQYLQQRQGMADIGLNAGIAAERDLRLGMNQQHALSDILANEQLYNQELDRNSSTIDKEELAYAEQLYNDRLSQGFGQAMDMSQFNQSENQFQAQMETEQRNQQADEQWRAYEFNNMSASERQKLIADAERFGLDQAWERHKFDAGLEFDAAYSGGSSSGSALNGNWNTTKGTPPQAFQGHLSQAIRATGVDESWIQPMSQLVANESTWNPSAKNPKSTAHGYAQFLDSTRKDYEKKYGIKYDTPVNQLILGIRYVQDRYGSPQKAMEFWNKNKWY